VIAVDTNLLVYAHRRDSVWHAAAAGVVRELAEAPRPWAIPWPVLHEFLAIVTHPRIYDPPSTLAAACQQIELWLQSPALVLLGEGPGYWALLTGVLNDGRVTGARVHDARIAALCEEHGVSELLSADRDFSRVTRLSLRNPLRLEP
jgi:toxin-antitoxin system PIN domain toxin